MSRIIESCRQCSKFSISLKPIGCHPQEIEICTGFYPQIKLFDSNCIPDFCPLPKLDDKMREAWKASTHATGSDMNAYEEWRKQNEH